MQTIQILHSTTLGHLYTSANKFFTFGRRSESSFPKCSSSSSSKSLGPPKWRSPLNRTGPPHPDQFCRRTGEALRCRLRPASC
ncbi:hypothetical protein NPIL_445541 [Nephila pilipes]|uniref:Uncharacterized protein n=1 Tax=Nephila pilipes TaxID=299642 RepID=A0A8X6UA17_NEPPI|nr:hypothetical protein NPIL_445541 [Nephila pilipes]